MSSQTGPNNFYNSNHEVTEKNNKTCENTGVHFYGLYGKVAFCEASPKKVTLE
uniref:Uncharacterized protein n=1 Tax=Trichobilharzia regenti TaxID=157069 RepID=A0AA85JAW8_TRIRE